VWSAQVERLSWGNGRTFLEFLQDEHLPDSLYYSADNDDKKATEDIQANTIYYILRDENLTVLQVLIPISEELQIHIYRSQGEYFLENIPIEYQEINKNFVTRIKSSSVYNDIKKVTNSGYVASFFVKILKDRVNFRQDIHKNSIVAMLYKRKFILGYPFGGIDLKIALLQTGHHKMYVIRFDSSNYNKKGESIQKNNLLLPIQKGKYRISSRFTKKRWHPILHKYRAHLGVDYAARRGTPIHATAEGKIIFAGKTRGYGNWIKIKHKGGYVSIYAHMKRFKKGLKSGQYVKQGDFLGEVGSTGLSTGPHLHFGLYKDGVAINPEKILSIEMKNIIDKKRKRDFIRYRDELIEQLNILVNDFKSGRYQTVPYSYDKLFCEATISNIDLEEEEEEENRTVEIRKKKVAKEVERYIEKNGIHLYTPPDFDELELSEDYMEY